MDSAQSPLLSDRAPEAGTDDTGMEDDGRRKGLSGRAGIVQAASRLRLLYCVPPLAGDAARRGLAGAASDNAAQIGQQPVGGHRPPASLSWVMPYSAAISAMSR